MSLKKGMGQRNETD